VALVVGTPGRLEDLASEGALDLSGVTYAVLDEADRMLDLGFEPAVRSLLSQTAKQRNTAMFSATWPPAVQAVAAAFIRDPVTVRVGKAHEAPEANKRVVQVVEVCEPHDKDRRLEALLKQYHSTRKNRVLIFALYKKEAARLERCVGVCRGPHAE
jgi:ATP-dependent RNA helicase DBP3